MAFINTAKSRLENSAHVSSSWLKFVHAMSDATTWSFTLEISVMNLEVSFSSIYVVYRTGITYDDCQ